MAQLVLAHDYLTQRGGAERVALLMAQAFAGAPLYTTLYQQESTFDGFAAVDVRVSPLNAVRVFRAHHRTAMPVLARAVSAMHLDADVVLASSSGWAHGMPVSGRKIVYCHAPARWLYQAQRYLGVRDADSLRARARRVPATLALGALAPALRRWDVRAARTADRYLANSTVTRDVIRTVYGIDAEVVPPPPALDVAGPESVVPGIEPGFFLCVARLLPYKNVDAVIGAVAQLRGARLVVVGAGPERARLQRLADSVGGRIRLLGRVEDDALRWLYRNCTALVAASYEDYGLSPLEAAAFGKPSVVLNAGGYLDTVLDASTGLFFDRPEPGQIRRALATAAGTEWDRRELCEHAATFSRERFQDRLRDAVGMPAALTTG